MKILITGAAGFIASHIADRYLALGHQVIIIDDLSTGSEKNRPAQTQFYRESILHPKMADIIRQEKPDIVNHHAAQIDVRKSVADPAADAAINILGTLKLLEVCREVGVKKVLFASSGGAIYGDQETYPADEKHRTEPQSPYGITKLTVEKYLQFYFWTYGMPFVALRYANVYGPRQNSHGEAGVVAIFTEKLLKGETPLINGDGTQTRDYVYVGDVVHCNAQALQSDVQGIFNVGTGVETDVNTLAGELIRLTGVSPTVLQHGPEKAGEQKRSCLKPGVLQKKPPTPLSEGLKKTVEWFQSRK